MCLSINWHISYMVSSYHRIFYNIIFLMSMKLVTMTDVLFLFLLNLLGGHWLIKLYGLKVYSSIICHLYTALRAHHPNPISFHHHIFNLLYTHYLPLPSFSLIYYFISDHGNLCVLARTLSLLLSVKPVCMCI